MHTRTDIAYIRRASMTRQLTPNIICTSLGWVDTTSIGRPVVSGISYASRGRKIGFVAGRTRAPKKTETKTDNSNESVCCMQRYCR